MQTSPACLGESQTHPGRGYCKVVLTQSYLTQLRCSRFYSKNQMLGYEQGKKEKPPFNPLKMLESCGRNQQSLPSRQDKRSTIQNSKDEKKKREKKKSPIPFNLRNKAWVFFLTPHLIYPKKRSSRAVVTFTLQIRVNLHTHTCMSCDQKVLRL